MTSRVADISIYGSVLIGNVAAWLDGLSAGAVASFITIVGGGLLWLLKEAGKARIEHLKQLEEVRAKSLGPKLDESNRRNAELTARIESLEEIIANLTRVIESRGQSPIDDQ